MVYATRLGGARGQGLLLSILISRARQGKGSIKYLIHKCSNKILSEMKDNQTDYFQLILGDFLNTSAYISQNILIQLLNKRPRVYFNFSMVLSKPKEEWKCSVRRS